MKTFEECQAHQVYCVIKESTIQTINDYIEHGFSPGGFLTAVLANDLTGSFGRADLENRLTLFQIVSYVYNEIPAAAHGSYETVKNWLMKNDTTDNQ